MRLAIADRTPETESGCVEVLQLEMSLLRRDNQGCLSPPVLALFSPGLVCASGCAGCVSTVILPAWRIGDYLTGRLLGKNCYGPEKVQRLKTLLGSLEDYVIYTYGDSKGDRELLAIAQYPSSLVAGDVPDRSGLLFDSGLLTRHGSAGRGGFVSSGDADFGTGDAVWALPIYR
jgi:hypothetical protein